MSNPRNCRHCTFMVCGDANWCSKHEECMSDAQIAVGRSCPEWEWNPIDALTFEEYEKPPERPRVAPCETLRMEL